MDGFAPTPSVPVSPASARHVDEYRDRGFAVVRGVFGPEEVAELAAAFDRQWEAGLAHPRNFRHGNLMVRVAQDPALGKVVAMVQWPSYGDPVLARYRTDPRLLALVEPLIGRDVKQIINQLHWKPAGSSGAEFAFHQDARFRKPRECYRNLGDSYVQTGIAIDPHRPVSGAMRMLPGSHRMGSLDLGAGAVMGEAATDEALRRAGLDPALAVDLELEPGDVALWSAFTVHGSGLNQSERGRRFYLNGYVRAADCDRGEWAWRDGAPQPLGEPVLVHFEQLLERPGPHYVDV
ncbi:phytanoyl-CoA dioxygenase family protein [Arenibaculum pallidiluteum]|uniref:phytanoyl-CoA dioxygenase family protein n=1 Tax=Arenibaculum pallidiluteum TaxID=2812559 RepID=UPI001A95A5E4|nr:phytanoyl-CoA dioxygenase family protein [Arenibaculum pallidiluteum]